MRAEEPTKGLGADQENHAKFRKYIVKARGLGVGRSLEGPLVARLQCDSLSERALQCLHMGWCTKSVGDEGEGRWTTSQIQEFASAFWQGPRNALRTAP